MTIGMTDLMTITITQATYRENGNYAGCAPPLSLS
jgi:hypothetical protein